MPNAPDIQHSGSRAFYSALTDRVTLPPPELFTSAEEYYATGFHELIHITGHQKRLARESILEAARFGSPTYSGEELVAEMGAAYLCAESGISPAVLENQATYIAGWLKRLRDDRKLVVHAAARRSTQRITFWGRCRRPCESFGIARPSAERCRCS